MPEVDSSDTPTPVDEAPSQPPGPCKPSKWLDSAFIETSLRSEHPDIAVTSLHVEAAVGAGENYACIVFRALVETNHGDYALILKCFPESEFRAKFILEGGIMEREIGMYKKTLPLLRGSLSKPNYPPCYHSVNENSILDTLVLRDMRTLGYRTSARQLGLDVAHCRLALTELAHLHGLSAALRVQQPEVFKAEIQDKYRDNFYCPESREKMVPFLNGTFKALAEAVKFKLPYRFHSIADLITDMLDIAYDEMIKCVQLPDSEEEISKKILVLNHGDFWSNNILFQYKEGQEEPLACSMVDFQISRCASPVLDLLYFFYTSTTQATRRAHMDELLQLYLEEACQAMSERGVTDPGPMFYHDVAHIKKEMLDNAIFGFQSSCFVLPLVIADAKDAPDMDSLTEEDFKKMEESPFLKMYSGPLFCKRFRELLEDFDDMGFCAQLRKKLDRMKE